MSVLHCNVCIVLNHIDENWLSVIMLYRLAFLCCMYVYSMWPWGVVVHVNVVVYVDI